MNFKIEHLKKDENKSIIQKQIMNKLKMDLKKTKTQNHT